MATQDKDKIVSEFIEAYTVKNGKAPTVSAKSGWYSVNGGKNVRLAQIEEMTRELSTGGGADANATKAPAKTTAAKKSKPKKGSFSVKNYYAEKLVAEAPGSILPR